MEVATPLIQEECYVTVRYRISYKGESVHVQVLEEVNLTTDLTPLYHVFRELIARRETNFVLSFPSSSFFYSQHLAVLLRCLEKVRETGGTVTILRPSPELSEALLYIDPSNFVRKAADTAELTTVLTIAG